MGPKPLREASREVDLHSRASREKLARMVVRLFEHWNLAAPDQAALLGLSAGSRATVARYRKGEPFGDSADLLARAGRGDEAGLRGAARGAQVSGFRAGAVNHPGASGATPPPTRRGNPVSPSCTKS